MKIFAMILVSVLALFLVSATVAQPLPFCTYLTETDQQIDSICGASGHPIADNTAVQIFQDLDPAGVGPEDSLAIVCNNPPECLDGPPGTVNFNMFYFNGEAVGFLPGQFYLDPYAFCASGFTPEPNRWYLVICLPGQHWVSNIVSPSPGATEIEMGPWTCINTPCAGCPVPPPPAVFNATDSTTCTGVQITWTYPDTVTNVDEFIIYREGIQIAEVPFATRNYDDNTALPNTWYLYSIKARRNCSGTFSYSSQPTDHGSIRPAPAAPVNVTATMNACTTVTVGWDFSSPTGLEYFVIKRDADSVGSILAGQPGHRTFVHHTTLSGTGQYTVCGWNTICGTGPCGGPVTGQALQPPAQVQNVLATDGVCDSTVITWDAVAGATSYHVWRSLNDGTGPLDLTPAGLPGTAVRYRDQTGVLGTTYRYWVRANNACGASVPSVFDTGFRLIGPGMVSNLSASDSAYCNRVHLSWLNVAYNQGYGIVRVHNAITDTLGPVAQDTVQFDDFGAAAGTPYTYSVFAISNCGNGPASAPNPGSVRSLPTQVTGVFATDTVCTGVIVIWNNVAGEDSFRIMRNTTHVGSVGANVLQYTDVTAVPGTTYDYSVLAVNACGAAPASTSDQGTRRVSLGAVTGLTATTNLCTGVNLSWSTLAGADSFVVFRDAVRIDAVLGSVTTYTDNVINDGANHNYTVAGKNSCGTGAESAPVVGRRIPTPPAIENLAATNNNCAAVIVTWTNAANADSFQVRRNGTRIGVTGPSGSSFSDVTAVQGTSYEYTVVSYNFCGTGSISTPVTGVRALTLAPTGLVATTTRCDLVRLTWEPVNQPVTLYRIYQNAILVGFTDSSTHTFDVIPGGPGTWSFSVTAYSEGCGESAPSESVVGTLQTQPSPVAGIQASTDRCDGVLVSWTPGTGGYDGFIVRRGTTVIDSAAANLTSFLDVDAPVGTSSYTVRPYALHCSQPSWSSPVDGARTPMPGAPSNVVASTDLCNIVVITWNDVNDETGYTIYRDSVQIGTVAADVVTFSDSTAAPGLHSYQVVGTNACGEGPRTTVSGVFNVVPAQVTSIAATQDSCSLIILTWQDVANAQYYRIFRAGVLHDSVDQGIGSYTDVNLTPGDYDYTLAAVNLCGAGPVSPVITGHVQSVPAQVTGVAASSDRCDGINITWTNLAGELKYWVYRNAVLLDSVNADTVHYLDTTVPVGQQTNYTVRARSICGVGPMSASVSGIRMQSPAVPAFLTVRDSCAMIYVNWGSAQGDVDSYNIYRDNNLVRTVPADTTDYVILDPVTGLHAYTVRAHSDECGDSNPTAAQNGTGHAAPGVPGSLAAAPAMCDSIRLTWTASTGDVQRYYIHRDGNLIDSTAQNRYRDVTVNNGANHSYTVTAFNQWCGASAAAGPVTGHLLPLVTMTNNVPATVFCGSTIWIHVSHCTVDNAQIFLSLDNGANYGLISTVSPVGDSVSVAMPDTVNILYPNSLVRIVSHHGARADTAVSNSFSLDCRLGVDQLDPYSIPTDFFLDQNYPNPFNPSTAIRFGVPRQSQVKVGVYDVLGREVGVVMEGSVQPGIHTINWDCSGCPSGMYLIRLQTTDRVLLRKMMLMK